MLVLTVLKCKSCFTLHNVSNLFQSDTNPLPLPHKCVSVCVFCVFSYAAVWPWSCSSGLVSHICNYYDKEHYGAVACQRITRSPTSIRVCNFAALHGRGSVRVEEVIISIDRLAVVLVAVDSVCCFCWIYADHSLLT